MTAKRTPNTTVTFELPNGKTNVIPAFKVNGTQWDNNKHGDVAITIRKAADLFGMNYHTFRVKLRTSGLKQKGAIIGNPSAYGIKGYGNRKSLLGMNTISSLCRGEVRGMENCKGKYTCSEVNRYWNNGNNNG